MAEAEAFFARSLPTSSQCGESEAGLFELAGFAAKKETRPSIAEGRAPLLCFPNPSGVRRLRANHRPRRHLGSFRRLLVNFLHLSSFEIRRN